MNALTQNFQNCMFTKIHNFELCPLSDVETMHFADSHLTLPCFHCCRFCEAACPYCLHAQWLVLVSSSSSPFVLGSIFTSKVKKNSAKNSAKESYCIAML